jgi:predicted carbohydrate-binding protein with CBM5 and CBM33 domain
MHKFVVVSDRKLEGIAVCYGEWSVVDSLILSYFSVSQMDRSWVNTSMELSQPDIHVVTQLAKQLNK